MIGDALDNFREAIRESGMAPPDAIEAGQFHRFPGIGKANGNKAGWCKLFDDERGGIFGDHSAGLSETWQARHAQPRTPAEQERFREQCEQARVEAEGKRQREHAGARERATAILATAMGDAAQHPYAKRKRADFGPLVKRGAWPQRGWSDALLVPMYDAQGVVQTVEAISADGEKDFLHGGKKRGAFHPFDKIRGASRVLIGEGLATVFACAVATEWPAAAAMDAGNLIHVARIVRELAAPGADIVIVADNDIRDDGTPNTGIEAAAKAAAAVGGRVAVPTLDGRKCDFWDVWSEGGVEPIRSAIANAKAPEVSEAQPNRNNATANDLAGRVTYRRAADIEAKPIRWLWPGRIARGKVSLLAGNPGLGKSQVTASMAAIVTTGGIWPVDQARCERGAVVILSAEDDPEDTIRPRLEAAGADLSRVFIVGAVVEGFRADGGETLRAFNLAKDLARLGAMLAEIGGAALVVIDPITAYLGDTDSHKNADIRALLAPLSDMAAQHGAAVVCVSHLNKSGGTDAMLRIMGSLAFVAAARAAFLVAKDQEDESRRLFLPLKNNNGSDRTGLAFGIRSATISGAAGAIATSRVEWEAEAVTVTADEAMAPHDDQEREGATALDEAAGFVVKLLGNGPVAAKDVKAASDANGHSWATVRRAAKAAAVDIYKAGMKEGWFWKMVGDERRCSTQTEDAHTNEVNTFGNSEHLRQRSDNGADVTEVEI